MSNDDSIREIVNHYGDAEESTRLRTGWLQLERARHRLGGGNNHSSPRRSATRVTCPMPTLLRTQFCFWVRSIISSKGKTGSPACAKFTAFCAREA
jgi:hypothetical protein